ncbi:MAG TPA: hypothetical protein VFQ58_00230 [Flavisolibacter sp.]|nr:hypothetical protein [Flavisolibacter sp.]
MKKTILIISLLIVRSYCYSQDRYFGRTYTSAILPKGNFDIELWHTSRFGHESEYFHAMDQRVEYEVGLGSNVQTAFYFNHFQKSVSDSNNNINQSVEIGFSNEWKFKISRPESKTLVALYAELGIKGDELELESKLIVDRSFGKNVIAMNLVYEIDGEAQRTKSSNRFLFGNNSIEIDAAFMHNCSSALGLGIEMVDHNDIIYKTWSNSILYAGPTLNYRNDKWFFVLNYLPQLTNLYKTTAFPKNKVLDEHEKAEARIILGFSF